MLTTLMKLVAATIVYLLCSANLLASDRQPPLIFCAESAPRSFDPSAVSDTATASSVSLTMFDRLVEYRAGGTELTPGLATSWQVSGDGKTYTFKLRSGVRFHANSWYTPTRTLNADDVVFSFKRQMDEAHPWYGENGTGDYGPIADMRDLVLDVIAADDLTVQFKLKRPYAPFLSNMAMVMAAIVSAEYAAAVDDKADRNLFTLEPVGTGPFRFIGYEKDVALRLAANPEYWRGSPRTANLIVAIVVDQATRTQKAEVGECHIAPHPNPADIAKLKSAGKVTVSQAAGLNYAYLAFNTRNAPFDNQQVRRALAMAIDKQTIVEAVYGGRASVASTVVPPGLWGHHSGVDSVEYDPAEARKILEREGIDDLTMKIWAMPVQRPYNPNGRRMAELIQSDFAKVGVEVEIVSYEWAEYLKRSRQVDRDGAVLLGWNADTVDPDNFLAPVFTCQNVGVMNRTQWCNAEYDKLIEVASATADRDKRTRIYRSAQEMLADQLPLVPIAFATSAVVLSKKVRGYVQNPTEMHLLHQVYLEQPAE